MTWRPALGDDDDAARPAHRASARSRVQYHLRLCKSQLALDEVPLPELRARAADFAASTSNPADKDAAHRLVRRPPYPCPHLHAPPSLPGGGDGGLRACVLSVRFFLFVAGGH